MINLKKKITIVVTSCLLLNVAFTKDVKEVSFLTPKEKPNTPTFEIHTGDPIYDKKVGNLIPLVSDNNKFVVQELVCLALNAYHEARGTNKKEQIATSYVVFNRVEDRNYPNTVCNVVWEHKKVETNTIGQFSWTTDGRSDTPYNKQQWHQAQRIAFAVYTDSVPDPTDGATNYYAHNKVNPYWSDSGKQLARLSHHTYLKLD